MVTRRDSGDLISSYAPAKFILVFCALWIMRDIGVCNSRLNVLRNGVSELTKIPMAI